ncbi:MAG: hypothetical protein R3F60_19190 [bacterium]
MHDLATDQPVTRGHRAAITQCAVSPSGERAATIDLDGRLVLWRLADASIEAAWQISPPGLHIFSPDDALVGFLDERRLIAGSGSGGVFEATPGEAAVPRAERILVTGARLDARGAHGIFVRRGGDAEVRTLGPGRDRTLWTLNRKVKGAGVARRVDISADGRLVLVVASRILVLDATRGTVRWQGPGQDAALSADGQRVAVRAGDRVTVLAVASGQVLRTVEVGPGTQAIALDASGDRLAFAGDRGLFLEAAGRAERVGPAAFARRVDWLAFSARDVLAHAFDAPYVHRVPVDGAVAAVAPAEVAPVEVAVAPAPADGTAPAEEPLVLDTGMPADEDAPAPTDGPVDVLAELVAGR